MKTLFITIGHGLVARNILRGGLLKALLSRKNINVVILSTATTNKEFVSEFQHPRISFEELKTNPGRKKRLRIVNLMHSMAIFNGTTNVKFFIREPHERFILIRKHIRRLTALLIGRSKMIRSLIMLIDRILLPDHANDELFVKYQPDLVFCTSIIMPQETDLLKAAKKRKIQTLGMVKSWDNLVKDIPLRIHPDRLLVWNKIMSDQAMKFQLMKRKDIDVIGIPQFDFYKTMKDSLNSTKKDFMIKIGADPNKKLIVFASAGKWSPCDPQIVEIIASFIKDNRLNQDCHLHVRPHPCWKDYAPPLIATRESGVVSVDSDWNESVFFPDNWDPSEADMLRLGVTMLFADVVVTSPSTIVLDAMYFDTPVVNIFFEPPSLNNGKFSHLPLYETEYYKELMEYKATDIARSPDELLTLLNNLIGEKSAEKSVKREKLRKDFIGHLDGKSSNRLSNRILGMIDEANEP